MTKTQKRSKVLNELFNICTNDNSRAADKIAAAKLYLDSNDDLNDSELRVIFENIDDSYLE